MEKECKRRVVNERIILPQGFKLIKQGVILKAEILTGEIEEADDYQKVVKQQDYQVTDVLQLAFIRSENISMVYHTLSKQNGVTYIEMMVNSQQLMVKYSDELRKKLYELGFTVQCQA